MNQTKVAIIGAGPAGISCAVQLKRYNIDSLIFEKNQIGGLIRNANLVENYIGFEKGISGQDLIKKFKKNLENLNITPIISEVKKVSFIDGYFNIETTKNSFTSEIMVISSGTKPKKLNIPKQNISTNEIFYDIAELPEINFSGKKFIIIGAGDAAFDYSINLIENYDVSEVLILNRSTKAKCLALLEKRAMKSGKIQHIKNISIKSIQKIEGKLALSCFNNNKNINLYADHIISAIGREPCVDFVGNEILENAYKLQSNGLLYFIGDVINGEYRQTSIASGNGIKAAMEIHYKC